jgi:hypothetical protein
MFALKEAVESKTNILLAVVDDDHFMSPLFVETLLREHANRTLSFFPKEPAQYRGTAPDAAIGFRGWRVKEDLTWGVAGPEAAEYVVQGVVSPLPATNHLFILDRTCSSHIELEY